MVVSIGERSGPTAIVLYDPAMPHICSCLAGIDMLAAAVAVVAAVSRRTDLAARFREVELFFDTSSIGLFRILGDRHSNTLSGIARILPAISDREYILAIAV